MRNLLLPAMLAFSVLTSHGGTIKATTDSEAGTKVRILLNANSATSPIAIDWGNGQEVKYTVDPSQPAYNRWIEGTIEGPSMVISGNVTEAHLKELNFTSVEIEGMAYLKELDLSKNKLATFDLKSITPLENLNLSNNQLVNNTYERRTLSLEYAGETLSTLNVGHNDGLICLDIRDLISLKYFSANDCASLGSVFICMPEDTRTELVNIDLSNCDLAHFYPVNLPNLRVLNLANNCLMTEADDEPFTMGNYPSLSILDISGNRQISSLDITGCTHLTSLDISDNRFERIDLSQAPELEVLYASNNNIPSFDLGNNPLMRTIHIAGNPVKELDVTRFPYIRSLDISNTSISRVMLMQASYLESFRAANTLIEFIDFNGQQAQRMRVIDIRDNKRMTGATMDYTLHTLPEAKSSAVTNLFISGSNGETADTGYATSIDMKWICDVTGDGTATHQNVDVTLTDATDTGENCTGTVDRLYPIFGLSMDYDFDIYSTTGGKFLISQWQPIYFQSMESITDKALTGVPIHIYPYPEDGKRFRSVSVNGKEIFSQWFVIDGPADIKVNFGNEENSLSFTSTPGNAISMLVNTTGNNGTVYVDWGTGTRNEYTGLRKYTSGSASIGGERIDGTASGTGKVTIYGDVAALDISGFGEYGALMGLWDNQVTEIDLSNAAELLYLNTYWNPISTVNLSGTPQLEVLNMGYNDLKTIDLSATPNLMWLDLHSDGFGEDGISMLSQIDVTRLPILQYLDLRGNAINSIDLSANGHLRWFNANSNNLSTIDVSKNPLLEELDLSRNKLSSIDISRQTELQSLVVSGNNLTSLDVSASPLLSQLHFDNNDIHFIDLSANKALRRIYLNGNGMNADELNDIYYLLPHREHGDDDDAPNQVNWNIAVTQSGDKKENEGTRADSSIAVDRGWTPSHQGSNGGSDVAYLDIITPLHGTVKVSGEDGTEYTHGSKVPKYIKLTITPTPEEGYKMTSFSLNGEEPIAATTFDMPGIYTKLCVTFAKDAGIEGIGSDNGTTRVHAVENGICVETPDAAVDIFRPDGWAAVSSARVNGTATFPLPGGTYIVRTNDGNSTTISKIIVR